MCKKVLALTLILMMALGAAQAQVQKIVITAGGDLVLGGDKGKRTDKRFAQYVDQFGEGYVLKNLKPLFAGDDITILNLEGPLKDSKRMKNPKRPTHLYGQPEYARILTAGSVEVVHIANNHIDDYNTKAATKAILMDNGIAYSDVKFSPKASSVTVRGITVGFVGFQTPYNIARMRQEVKNVKKQCQVAVVSFHFGEVPERTHPIKNSQVKMAHAAIDAGADLVLGHHPHVVSGIEVYKGKYVFYDLGAVESSGEKFRYPNMLARITLLVDKQAGTVRCNPPVIYPGFTSSAGMEQDNNCQPMLTKPGDPNYEKVFELIDKTSARKGITPGPYVRGK